MGAGMSRAEDNDVTTTVLFFGRLAEQLGRECEVAIPKDGCSVAELRRRLTQQAQVPGELSRTMLAAVDQEMAADELFVRPGQEIAFFSPLSGG